MVKPIFILGSPRCGTTWLGNILCQHKDISGAQQIAHWGIHESKIFRNIIYWGDLKDVNRLINFLELYSSGDYFKLVEGEKDFFYRNPPEDFLDFFFSLMDRYAKKKNSKYWITKLSPIYYYHPNILREFIERLKKRYSEYKFIGVKRDFRSALRSHLKMPGTKSESDSKFLLREFKLLMKTGSYIVHYSGIKSIIDSQDGLILSFNDLQQNREDTVKKIVAYLDLEWFDKMLEDAYLPNSSFIEKKKKIGRFIESEINFINICLYPILSKIPNFLQCLARIRDKRRTFESPMDSNLRLLKMEYLTNKFKEELKKTNNKGLYNLLFQNTDGDNLKRK